MPRLSEFIRENRERILSEWETFARSLPMGHSMGIEALRDHAGDMLRVISRDMDSPQSATQELVKSEGQSDASEGMSPTAAQSHGSGRAGSGFAVEDMVAEFRALRASVIRLWSADQKEAGESDLADMIRFNEAIDQAIAESIVRFTSDLGVAKDRFLAILGHDLRTPLSAIVTSSTFMLDMGDLAEPNRTLVGRIANSAKRMNQMVSDLLDFARTRFGDEIPIVRASTDVRTLVTSVVSEVGVSHPTADFEMETSGDLRGNWDPARLTQAITNLVANAVYHGSLTAPIRVSARGSAREIVLSVQNQGKLIPEAELAQIFAPGKSGSDAQDKHHLGLGLYIVQNIVAAHKGFVEVHSSEERGTIFTVHLPRAEPTAA
jgi:signal transduction histidine kinase